MTVKHRRLKPAAYAVINAAVFAVCAVTFYQIGKHRIQKPETAAIQNEESSSVPERTSSAETSFSDQTITTVTTAATESVPLENQWHYWDYPWASAYQELLWSGEYQADFLKHAVYFHTNGHDLDDRDHYRNMDADIDIYAALIYLDEDDTPELALTSAYHTTVYTYTDDALQLVASINTLNNMLYYPKKSWLGDHFFRTMGGISYAEIYDFSEQGLKNGTEQKKHLEFWVDEAEKYELYPNQIEYSFGGQWREINTGACLVSSFSPNDVITKLHDALPE